MGTINSEDDFDTIREEFKNRVKVQLSDATAEDYDHALRKWAEWLNEQGNDTNLWNADTANLRSYISQLVNEDYAASTIKGRRAGVGKFYEIVPQLIKEDAINVGLEPNEIENPNDGLDLSTWNGLQAETKQEQELGKDFYYLTPAEKEELCDNVPSPRLRNDLIIRLLYQTGLRAGELARCRVTTDIDRDTRKITVRSTNAKNGKRRTTYYRESLDFAMSQWIDAGHRASVSGASSSPYLFPTRDRDHITPTRINLIVVEAAEKVGLQEVLYVDKNGNERVKVTAHALRHSFAIQSLLNGMDLKTLQDLLGHENLETTEAYLEVIEQHKRRIASERGAGVEDVSDDGKVNRPTLDTNGEERSLNRRRR